MKWILIAVLIMAIMLIARGISEQYKDKYDFYNNLKVFLNQFKLNLSFKQAKIETFLKSLTPKKQFATFVQAYINYLKGEELDLTTIKILEENELSELKDILINLGKYDTSSELKQIDSFLLLIDQKLTKANEDKNKICPMILKLSLLFAIGLAILLI